MPRAPFKRAEFRTRVKDIYNHVLPIPPGDVITYETLSELAKYDVRYRRQVIYNAFDKVTAETGKTYQRIYNEGYTVVAPKRKPAEPAPSPPPPAAQPELPIAKGQVELAPLCSTPWVEVHAAVRRMIQDEVGLVLARMVPRGPTA